MKKIIPERLKKALLFIFIPVSVLLFSFSVKSDDEKNFELLKNLDIFHSLIRELNIFYVDDINPGEMINIAIDAMLESLDPYTVFIPESQMEDLKLMTTGEYGGIGALIRQDGEDIVITDPYQGYPAQKNDIRAGDIILEIDGKSMKGKSSQDVSELLKGQPKTPLKLLLKRPGVENNLEKTIEREEIKIKNVQYSAMVGNDLAYVNLSNFTENASAEVKKAIQDLKAKHDIKGVILDLRGNPGGLLIEAVNVSNIFINKGEVIVSTKGKVKDWDKNYTASMQPFDTEIPIAVLVNSGSASASEIVAGAMQDLDRGVIIGQRTFGKGLVQTTRDLSYKTKLKVTTAKYYTPSGRCIQVIDYTHRNTDGSAGKIPDSLITKFSTRNKRVVYDGGGINPDIILEQEKYSNIAISLVNKNHIFNFATRFFLEHPTIAPASEFDISDELYNSFIEYLKDKDYDYITQSDDYLKKLVEITKEEKYYDDAKEDLTKLEKKLAHDKMQDLKTFRPEISRLLQEEIVSRYYFQDGRIESFLKDDKELKEAIKVLHSPEEYKKLLSTPIK
ncbi:MAG: peptidase S41 [Bacteroidetes bacterium HGW-Bacteroidetes-21]|jgi:carboxyl-terminal processing protease|nr:MAG: peptidase S41 [Bacteroidetes bacterium HGW-Bacteroidetes-21]